MNEITQITEKIKKFRDDRDWMQFYDPNPIIRRAKTSLLENGREVFACSGWPRASDERSGERVEGPVRNMMYVVRLYHRMS